MQRTNGTVKEQYVSLCFSYQIMPELDYLQILSIANIFTSKFSRVNG